MATATAKTRKDDLISPARIRAMALKIARAFSPSRVILFGSYATGKADAESDIDLLVLFKTKPSRGMVVNIRKEIQRGFALDVIALDERTFRKRVSWGDFFLMDILETGKVLYESPSK